MDQLYLPYLDEINFSSNIEICTKFLEQEFEFGNFFPYFYNSKLKLKKIFTNDYIVQFEKSDGKTINISINSFLKIDEVKQKILQYKLEYLISND